MSGTALFVGNLPWSTTSQQLKEVSTLPATPERTLRGARCEALSPSARWPVVHAHVPSHVRSVPCSLCVCVCVAPPLRFRQVFSEYNVKTAEVKAGYDGRSRGYGIVTFESEEDAAAGLSLGGYNLDGREMLVRFDRQSGE